MAPAPSTVVSRCGRGLSFARVAPLVVGGFFLGGLKPCKAARKTSRREAREIISQSAYGGDAGIRTLDRALQPYNGLANRRLQPLGHVSSALCAATYARRIRPLQARQSNSKASSPDWRTREPAPAERASDTHAHPCRRPPLTESRPPRPPPITTASIRFWIRAEASRDPVRTTAQQVPLSPPSPRSDPLQQQDPRPARSPGNPTA
jgi:hypothetical protein